MLYRKISDKSLEALATNVVKHFTASQIDEALSFVHGDYADENLLDKDFKEFFIRCFSTLNPATELLPNWHIDCICEYLEACRRREIKRLQINIPPRYLKSTLGTIAFPAWILAHNPSEQILCASHSKALSLEHSVSTRLIMESLWYRRAFPRTRLAFGQREKTKFFTTKRGSRTSTSTGASTIGMGGNFLIADDLIDPEKAYSEQHRHVANRYYDQSFSTRLNDKKQGVIIIIMQRLHEDDTCGHTLGQEDWTRLVIPAEAPKPKIYVINKFKKEVKRGEVLHADREDIVQLRSARKRLGSYGYSGQYMQKPTPEEGGIININWFKRYKELPNKKDIRQIVQIWDTAQKENEIVNDPWVCGTWFLTYTDYYLAHVYRDWLNYPDGKRKVIELYERFNPQVVVIEDKSTGSSLLQELTNIPRVPFEPEQNKLARLQAESPAVEAGFCHLPIHAEWLHDFEHEIKLFPNSTYKDQADMLSCFLYYVRKRKIDWDNMGFGQQMVAV